MLLAGCSSSPPRAPAIGEAYAGPPTLNLRSDIPLQSPPVTVVKHGERLQILQQRRSFVRVRAPNGKEGWTEQRQLLGAGEMAGLKALAELAANMPPQGRATTDADLRVHIEPAPLAPSFLLLKANDKVDVLAHLRRPRTDLPRKPLIPPAPKKAKATKPGRNAQYTIPMPLPPPPPANWLDLSKTDESEPDTDEPPSPPQPTDDWSLVRAPDGEAGWALTRLLRMAIPDEVAQYAEGHRIVAYFSLGSVQDGDQRKDTWLWTTVGDGVHPYDFDGFRVFWWNPRRHRYETEYIQRNIVGYLPVELQKVQYDGARGREEDYQGFSVCVQKSDGQLYRQQFAVVGNLIRFAGEQPCQLPPPINFENPAATPAPTPNRPKTAPEGLFQRVAAHFKRLKTRWFGR